MKKEIPSRTVVSFPPIHQAVSCSDGQLGPKRTTKKVQPAASQPQPNVSNSWPKVGFQPQPRRLSPTLPGSLCANAPSSASGVSFRKRSDHSLPTSRNDSGEECFSLSLTPEAVLVIQKRSLEQQLSGSPKGKSPLQCPAAPACSVSSDIGSLLKISLLNDQHKYDDMEYEEEGEAPDRSVLQKCQEWLQGVERARTPAGRLAGLPRLPN
ncbi:proline-rich protein 18 [Narcine bancroftii]|uniref:proline-rich protein 18 n=1 Tax=Narcine bancroftii TaxID=1343680 RepID=UPI003831EF7A